MPPRDTPGAWSGDPLNPLKVVDYLPNIYDWASFTVTTGTTNYDVLTNVTNLFKNVKNARRILIWHNQDISVRFNNTAYPAITHEAVYEPHEWNDILKVSNIYITNSSGATVTVKIFLS